MIEGSDISSTRRDQEGRRRVSKRVEVGRRKCCGIRSGTLALSQDSLKLTTLPLGPLGIS